VRPAARAGGAALGAALLLCGCFNDLDWREFRSADGRYAASMPGKVVHERRTLTTPAGSVTMQMDSTTVGSTVFGVGYADYPGDYLARTRPDEVASNVRDALVKNIGGRGATESPLADTRHPGQRIHAEGRSGDRFLSLDAQLVFSGNRFYQVVAIGETGRVSKEDLDLYFASFRITD
jgi:hypothetical protein